MLRSRAAIAIEPAAPLVVDEIHVDGPAPGECLVKIAASGVCHTDLVRWSGADKSANFPCILGHEGAGVVVDVGKGVTGVKVGDHVIPSHKPECRECEYCLSRKSNLCLKFREPQRRGLMCDGTSRYRHNGRPVFHYMGVSSFSEYVVVPEISVAAIDKRAPLERACLLGCGVGTGLGAVINVARVFPGSSVVVFGLGCIGLSAIMGAKISGARKIIGVDVDGGKEAVATALGATDFLLATADTLADSLTDLLGDGADFTFECVGKPEVMRTAFEAAHRGWGVCVLCGVAASGATVQIPPEKLAGRTLRGTAFGGYRGRTDVPMLADWLVEGRLPLDVLVQEEIGIEELPRRWSTITQGSRLRTIIRWH
ncbi:alcohol dehydrogenase catalytic domain-containing protein [Roseomonas mucosa]|uniref:alcohol dehydrogenase catalytic domain-containing protein n=1 Tax=Roseomonas mucosa TaxID=207340 RepID=UPI002AF6C994|nr:alcohol dehydrogenase catalytic domain-containing protein [Roseomonas mucosa]UZO94760.1 Glutathione-dependent formaldehyde dehydrogenase [Roseomonas mucosa]